MKPSRNQPCALPDLQRGGFTVGIAFLFSLVLQLAAASGTIVFTPLRGYSPEDYTRIPFSLEELHQPSCRYQQVYGSSEFIAANSGGPLRVTSVSFISDNKYGRIFGAELPKFQMLMGVTRRDPDGLSEEFGKNCTSGMVNVYGPSNVYVGSAGPFVPFSIVLQTPFRYDPLRGNLLLEIRHYEPVPPPYRHTEEIPGVLDFWNVEGDAVSRVYAFDVNATSGTADTGGLTTRFRVEFLEPPLVSISALRQSTNLVVRWPIEAEGYVLQQSPALGTGETWTSVGGTITTNGANREMVLPLDSQATAKFYRLFLPPPEAGAGSQPPTGTTSINIPSP